MSIIDTYLQRFEPPVRTELERIHAVSISILPGCEETISYGMPTLKYQGKSIFGFDVHKNHIGLYPFSGHVISEIEELKNYRTSKGAIRVSLNRPIPDELIKKIIKERLKQAI